MNKLILIGLCISLILISGCYVERKCYCYPQLDKGYNNSSFFIMLPTPPNFKEIMRISPIQNKTFNITLGAEFCHQFICDKNYCYECKNE
jgi:hypothetical protein